MTHRLKGAAIGSLLLPNILFAQTPKGEALGPEATAATAAPTVVPNALPAEDSASETSSGDETTVVTTPAPAAVEATKPSGPGAAATAELRLNPFECYGRYESATGSRSMGQIRIELKKKFDQLSESDPAPVRAMKFCVIARIKARLGDSDARTWFERSVEADPEEPGYELFFGMYYAMARGARGPVLEEAEVHFYRALEKLEALRERGRFMPYHDSVNQFLQKRLLVLYQKDGQPLLPFKAYDYDSSGLHPPSAFASVRGLVSADTRDFFYNSEMRTFTGERLFSESAVRKAAPLTPRELWDLARAPLRTRLDGRLRLRQNLLGAIDLSYASERANLAQIESFYLPVQRFVDVEVNQVGAGYDRVLPLYPLFDLRLAGGYKRTMRSGAIEFLPERRDEFDLWEFKPSLSRFVGSDKLTLDFNYVHMDIADLPGGVPEQAMREKVIRGGRVEYAFYSPLTLPAIGGGLGSRSLSRGFALYAGGAQDDETYGIRRVTRRDVFGGARYDSSGSWSLELSSTYYQSRTILVDPNQEVPEERTDTSQNFASIKGNLNFGVRIVDEQSRPLVPETKLGFGLDMLELVLPLQLEVGAEGPTNYENFRAGIEVWGKLFQLGTGGTALLLNAGYDAQYFYQLGKTMHLFHTGLRVGWEDL